jgi:O-antigen ligase
MNSEVNGSYIRYLAAIPLLSTLIVTPGLTTEAQILGKFTFFAIAVMSLAILLNQKGTLRFDKFWTGISLAIIVSFLASTLAQGQNLSEQLFGVYGRNNGLILLISSMVFFLISVSQEIKALEDLTLKRLSQAGWFVLAYFYIQLFGWDLIPWNQIYGTPVSTLGNPNFLSAFISLIFFANFGHYITSKRDRKSLVLLLLFCLLASVALFLSNSQQGFLLLLVGAWILLGKFFFEREKQLISRYWMAITVVSFVAVALGVANIGIGQRIFQEYSLAIRREYWLAGISMFKDKPIFGNGFDSYLYNFDANKSENFVRVHGESLTSSSAHNVYIDSLQGSGIFAGLLYLALNFLVMTVAAKRVLRGGASQAYWILFIIWILIQVQSLISIQNVAINAWQWLIAGVLVSNRKESIKKSERRAIKELRVPARGLKIPRLILTPIFLVILSLSPLALIQDVKFAGSIKTSNGSALIDLSKTFPFDTYRANYTARALENGKYWHWAIEVAKESVRSNPKNKEGWLLILNSRVATSEERQLAREAILRLDPFWKAS